MFPFLSGIERSCLIGWPVDVPELSKLEVSRRDRIAFAEAPTARGGSPAVGSEVVVSRSETINLEQFRHANRPAKRA